MRALTCPTCGLPVFFENDRCLSCGTELGFEPSSFSMVPVTPPSPERGPVEDRAFVRCANAAFVGCNWVVPGPAGATFCRSCSLTRTRPPDRDAEAHERFIEAEAAKRRLVAQLLDLDLPIASFEEHPEGLGFDLLSSRFDQVMIGHEDGVITLDLAEADDAHRERVRVDLGEAYRTVLGHFRHEVGHYYWMVLVRDGGRLDEFRDRFGDERADYGQAVSSHYGGSGPTGWEGHYVSAYATMHPWEDWAETFAHYLHLRDTLQTASETGVTVVDPLGLVADAPQQGAEEGPFDELVREWIALAAALNALNRSMGAGDLYPFVLAPEVIDKLAYVDALVRGPQGDGQLGGAKNSSAMPSGSRKLTPEP